MGDELDLERLNERVERDSRLVVIRDGFGTERDRFRVGMTVDPLTCYASEVNVPVSRLIQAGWKYEFPEG